MENKDLNEDLQVIIQMIKSLSEKEQKEVIQIMDKIDDEKGGE